MARPKRAAAGRKPAAGEKSAADRLGIVVTLKGSPEWKAWVDELATFDRSSVAALIDRALAHYGKAIGFRKEAPSR
jgi:hypothetical protein